MYDDDYPTCDATRATLRIYLDTQDPEYITEYLGITPTRIQKKGEQAIYKGKETKQKIRLNGWFLETEHIIQSRDSRRHIDYILDRLIPVKDKLSGLMSMGAEIDIQCFWRTVQGHGGPVLSCDQFVRLAQLKIDLWYDFYC